MIQYLEGHKWVKGKVIDIDTIRKPRLFTLRISKPSTYDSDIIFNCCSGLETRNFDIIKLLSPEICPVLNNREVSVANIKI